MENCNKTIENLQGTIASGNEVIANLKRVNLELEEAKQAMEMINEQQQGQSKAVEEELQAEKKEAKTWRIKY